MTFDIQIQKFLTEQGAVISISKVFVVQENEIALLEGKYSENYFDNKRYFINVLERPGEFRTLISVWTSSLKLEPDVYL